MPSEFLRISQNVFQKHNIGSVFAIEA